MNVKKINKCILDNKSNLDFVYSFGKMKPTGIFKKNKVDPINLSLNICKKYNFGQITKSLKPKIMFNDYYYRSGITLTMKDHFNYLAKLIKKKVETDNKLNILDIGCNDGTFLNILDKKFSNLNCYGLDPSKAINDAKLKFKKYKFIKDFFPSKKLINNKKYHNQFKLITCTSVFYDFPNPVQALKDIRKMLSPDGIFLCEVNYFVDLIKKCNFDMISHEHLSFYSLKAFLYCCSKAKLNITDVKLNEMNGGNIVFICSKNPEHKVNSSVNKILKVEDNFFKTNWKKNFIEKINISKKHILNHLTNLKKNGKRVAIYGASTRGDTVLQLFPEIEKYVDFAIDKMKIKHGLNMPGTKIKIYHESKTPYKVDSYFVLPYYFMKEFIKKEKKFIDQGGEIFTFKPKFILIKNKKMKISYLRKEFLENLNQNIDLHKKLVSESKKIDDISNLICGKLKKGGKILFCGNGGSAADAQHMVAELLVRLTSNFNRDPLPALTLIQDISTITACGNDYNFVDVLIRNFRGLANKNDVLFAITTSGNSKNIIKVLKYAKERNFLTIGLLGNNGGKSLKYCKKSIVVPSKNTARIQECHIFLGHCILHQVEKKYFHK